jgi:hypothetical protein
MSARISPAMRAAGQRAARARQGEASARGGWVTMCTSMSPDSRMTVAPMPGPVNAARGGCGG